MTDDAVPTIAPHELTYRVGWEVIEQTPEQLTVRIKKLVDVDPADSDGIPQAVDAEVSVRGSSEQVTDRAGHAKHITPAVKVSTLTALAEMAFRDGLDLMDYPILTTPEPGKQEVKIYIKRFRAFVQWFTELAQFDFADMERYMGRVSGSMFWFHQRRAGLQVCRELFAMLPTLRQFDDTPHLLIHL